jgi:hypothetical protein
VLILLPDSISRDRTVQDEFNDTAKMDSGWILGSNEELLFWVPPWSRVGLWRPGNTAVIGVQPVKLDFSQFRHGTAWHEVDTDVFS